MKTFNYHTPKDVKGASKLASTSSAFLAGGMTSIPSMKLGLATYKDIIDINHILYDILRVTWDCVLQFCAFRQKGVLSIFKIVFLYMLSLFC